ncbi:diguanylate cyclase [Ancylobacter pratisalsi]
MSMPDKLLALYENSQVLVAAYDDFDRLRYANRSFRETFFLEPDEEPFWHALMRRNFEAGRGTVIRASDFDEWLTATLSRRGKIGFRAFETDLVGGRWLWMTEAVDSDGWMLCIASDITALKASSRTLRQDRDFAMKAAYTDDLTGVNNRRYAMARIEDMLASPKADPLAGCVAMLDLDNFKYINDRYGHRAGDFILKDFAKRIQEQVRRADCFGRVGGEEFILVFPTTSISEAELIVERMLGLIRISRPLPEDPDFHYSFSAGLAAATHGDTASDLCAKADRALYAAKMAGRNCIVLEKDLATDALRRRGSD